MRVQPLSVDGAFLITPTIHRDERGEFCESFVAPAIGAALASGWSIAQVNTSWSRRGTLRGLHLATADQGQAKLVQCPSGSIIDIIVDARADSPTFGRHSACLLDSQNRSSLLVPSGVAHSFMALTDATVTYACSSVHDPQSERALDALDPELALPWPAVDHLLRSQRDRAAHSWSQAHDEGWLPVFHQRAQW